MPNGVSTNDGAAQDVVKPSSSRVTMSRGNMALVTPAVAKDVTLAVAKDLVVAVQALVVYREAFASRRRSVPRARKGRQIEREASYKYA